MLQECEQWFIRCDAAVLTTASAHVSEVIALCARQRHVKRPPAAFGFISTILYKPMDLKNWSISWMIYKILYANIDLQSRVLTLCIITMY